MPAERRQRAEAVDRAKRAGPLRASTRGAAGWFERLTNASFPAPRELSGLRKVGHDVWATRGLTLESIDGFPAALFAGDGADVGEAYTILGAGGYGIESYALYYTVVEPNQRLYLRLAFGGVYVDPDLRRDELVADLRFFLGLRERLRASDVAARIVAAGDEARVHLGAGGDDEEALLGAADDEAAVVDLEGEGGSAWSFPIRRTSDGRRALDERLEILLQRFEAEARLRRH